MPAWLRFTIRIILTVSCIGPVTPVLHGQCPVTIAAFPYTEGFESSNGGWVAGGSGSDWAWGTPNKPVIQGAGSGSKCWITGGLTGSSYTSAEASWLKSPCFDFSGLRYPIISMKIFWETEQQFDGASFQYSTDNGISWTTLGSTNEAPHCLNANWYNYSPITYLSALTSTRDGWSGTIQASSGNCRGGNGSNGWVTARHIMPALGGKPSVLFRFIFGAGTICNNYDGFAVDDILVEEAPPNLADFTDSCINSNTIKFSAIPDPCPTGFSWNFGDPGSGNQNTSLLPDPVHVFSGPGTYPVTLTVSGPGNAPDTITKEITIISLTASLVKAADCQLNNDGIARVSVTGGTGPYTYSWNTVPVQQSPTAQQLAAGTYTITVEAADACKASTSITIPPDSRCSGIYFPSAFTPNGDSRNDLFGVLGAIGQLTEYRLSIYNRWGERVFHSTDPDRKWDGTIRGARVDSNVYSWWAEFSVPGEGKQTRKGTVMLIR